MEKLAKRKIPCYNKRVNEGKSNSRVTIIRVAGALFFLMGLAPLIDCLDNTVAVFSYIASDEFSVFWGVYFVISTVAYCLSVGLSMSGTATAALFGGVGYRESLWVMAFWSTATMGLYSSLQTFGGTEGVFVPLTALGADLAFALIIFFALKDDKDGQDRQFNWKEIFFNDDKTKLSARVAGLLAILIIIAAFILAHK